MKSIITLIAAALLVAGCSSSRDYAGLNNDRGTVEKTNDAIQAAFAHGDVATIMTYLHPDVVIKAFTSDSYISGTDEVQAYLTRSFKIFNLEIVDNHVESTTIENGTAVEKTLFTIKGTPKNGGDPFMFKVQSMNVYVKYKNSPTGWASVRQVVLPADK